MTDAGPYLPTVARVFLTALVVFVPALFVFTREDQQGQHEDIVLAAGTVLIVTALVMLGCVIWGIWS